MPKHHVQRFPDNPIFKPSDVVPSAPELKVDGIFNCAVTTMKDKIVMVCRVAESALSDAALCKVPVLSRESGYAKLSVETYEKNDASFDFKDKRAIRRVADGKTVRLTSLSHFRLAYSEDGRNFTLEGHPWIFPYGPDEEWGIEDPRITTIDDVHYVVYSSVGSRGVSVSMVSTKDFKAFTRLGVLLPPTNKDAALFPEKIDGSYWMLHRPAPSDLGGLNIWICKSKDLRAWGDHRLVAEAGAPGAWDEGRIGVGPPPISTDRGWLVVYHGADRKGRYSAGLLLLDRKDPSRVVARGREPILTPEADYERKGFFPNVVFPCGVLAGKHGVTVYYGAADDKTCGVEISWESVWELLS